jgi:rubrerythrin
MQGLVIIEAFGFKVLLRSLLAGRDDTFLDIVMRCAQESAHNDMVEIDLLKALDRFAAFERRARDIYRELSEQLSGYPDAARFFRSLSSQEEGHAIVLCRVRREIRRGRLWKKSKDLHFAMLGSLDAMFANLEHEVRTKWVSFARALEIVEHIEQSELDVVFESLSESVEMRMRGRFERFFVVSKQHSAYWREQVQNLRAVHLSGAGAA